MSDDTKRIETKAIAHDHINAGNPLGWFEAVYQAAGNDSSVVPWADRGANPSMVQWLSANPLKGEGKRALVVGCGLGDDAEEVARRGFSVTAFDIAPTAVEWCKDRFPDSPVAYACADLFDLPAEWRHAFDFIFEANTLQTLPDAMRAEGMACMAQYLAVDGTLLVVARARDKAEMIEGPPWPLAREEFEPFKSSGLQESTFEDYMDNETPPIRRFRIVYKR